MRLRKCSVHAREKAVNPNPLEDATPGVESARTAVEAAPSPQESRSFVGSTFASLAYREFRYLWLGQITHAAALWLDMIARPLLILELTSSPVHLGLVLVARTVPAVALGVVAGVVADNFNRRTVLLTTKVAVLSLSALFALILLMDWMELWHVYLFVTLRGATMAFDQPARRAMIPSIVPRHLVTNAMALSGGSIQVTRIVGAAGAGLIIAAAGLEAAFVSIAVVYAGAVFFTWKLRSPDTKREGGRSAGSMATDLVQGIRFAWNDKTVRGIIILASGYFTFGMAFMFVFAPLFATDILDIGESGFGYMMSLTGVGGVVGALVLASANPRKGRGTLTIGLLALFGTLLVLLSATTYTNSVALVFLLAALLGLGQSSFIPLVNAMLLDVTPDHLRGRVIGLLSLDRAMSMLGGAGAGFLAAAVGPQAAQLYFGVACVLTALAMFSLYPSLRRID